MAKSPVDHSFLNFEDASGVIARIRVIEQHLETVMQVDSAAVLRRPQDKNVNL
jgi:hypothetical protein